ncbi:MAG TPA: Stp1/IreP family PP2C-type Ser/Thr phosphatase [Blastocatellia bacterium]|nr:Stp1/IreP family PP2C-type Ser/Thr phosphatase [Blastocatellia bacterium]
MFSLWKKKRGADRDGSRGTQPQAHQQVTSELKRPGEFKCEIAACLLSDVGCARDVNEDSGKYVQPGDSDLLRAKGSLLLVCDGMGGHSAGEVASGMAVDVITRVYYDDTDDAQASLVKAFEQANREIYEASTKDETRKGMGTTGTALVLKDGRAFSAHVGDSRAYLIRNGQIYVMTQDHSEVMEMVKRGLISLEEARHHPDKNVILRALGSHPEVEVSTWDAPFPIREDDLFLLCSDGLYDLVENDEIRRLAISADPRPACESLIALAKERGGHDNITVGIVQVRGERQAAGKPLPMTREMEAGI